MSTRSTSNSRVYAKGSSTTSFTKQQRTPSGTRTMQSLDQKAGGGKTTTATAAKQATKRTLPTRTGPGGATNQDDLKKFVQTLDSKETRRSTPLSSLRKQPPTSAGVKKPDSAPAGKKQLTGSLRTTPSASSTVVEKRDVLAPPPKPKDAFTEKHPSPTTSAPASDKRRSSTPSEAKPMATKTTDSTPKKGYGAGPAVRPKQPESRTPVKPKANVANTSSPKTQRDVAAALLENWPKPDPEVDAFLDGSKMETPFSGEYHRHAADTGFFVCIRCAAPLFGVKSRVVAEGGYLAFQRCNSKAMDLQLKFMEDETIYHIRCMKCNAFVGKFTQELLNVSNSGEIVRVNSKSIKYIDATYRVKDTTFENDEAEEDDEGAGWGTGDLDGLTKEEHEDQQRRINEWGQGRSTSLRAAPNNNGGGGGGGDEYSDDSYEEETDEDEIPEED